jgi:hypothetical protein
MNFQVQLLNAMDDKGDIPERDEVEPENTDTSLVPKEAKYKAQLVKEIMESGGQAHVYFKHTQGEGEDRHLYPFFTHVFPEHGLVYWHAHDEDHWGYAGDMTLVERHYED